MNFAVALGSAFAIHAAAAAGVLALGVNPGASCEPHASDGVTIQVEQDAPRPVVGERVDDARPVVAKHASRGAPNHPAAARSVVTSSADTPSDFVPEPTTTAPPPEPVRFKMGASSTSIASIGFVASAGRSNDDGVIAEANVTERARHIAGAAPAYPEEARAQGIELAAPLAFEIVVDETGRVVSARPLRHAGYGFDEAALGALRTYRFAPAKRDGRAVAVRMTWTIDFHFE